MKGMTTLVLLFVIDMTIKIGVLGGIGPDATAEFYIKLIDKLRNSGQIKSNRDFPQIIINSIPAPELVYEDVSEQEIKPYMEGLLELDKAGSDFIAMVCNTIHLYYERLQKEIRTPIINLKTEVMEVVKERGIKSAIITGTPNTIKKGLYRFDGIRNFELSSEEARDLGKAVFDFNMGVDRPGQIKKLRYVCGKYLWHGS